MDVLEKQLMDNTTVLVEQFKSDLEALLRSDRGLKADSDTLNSLLVVVNDTNMSVSLQGVDYIYYVIHGRGPGRFPPPDANGKWMPFPVAAEIAAHGNKKKYAALAAKFDDLYDKLIEDVDKKAGEIALSYARKFTTINTL